MGNNTGSTEGIDNIIISLIIPVYNDPKGLKDTIESLIDQTFPEKNYELIIVDNGSNDNTIDVAKNYQKRFPELVSVVTEYDIKGTYAARNKGIFVARGRYLSFIDSDMIVAKGWLSKVCSLMKEKSLQYLGCNVELVMSVDSITGKYNKLVGFPVKRYLGNSSFAPTCCLTINRDIIYKYGAFDSRFISGGDLEFGNRVFINGTKLFFSEKIIMYHPARYKIEALLKKQFRVGRGLRQLYRYYPERHKKEWRNIINPKHYLPYRLQNFVHRFSEPKIWDDAPEFIKFCFYFLACAEKIAQHFGYCYELFVEVGDIK